MNNRILPINLRLILSLVILSNFAIINVTATKYDIVVAKDGSGNFTTISRAIASLPMYNYERVVIFIKNGIYQEKIRIECDYVTLLGENRDSTIIEYNSLRSAWIANPDFIGPAVVNIHADDIILKNLTVRNTQPEIGPHAFAIYGTGTRTMLINCSAISKGGDTVSLWNYEHGMYYHSDCYFEGAVDFVCPRGWCYIRDSEFYEVKEIAALWHAAVLDPNQKFVIDNCIINGVDKYYLARHHYEAQFFFMGCTFSGTMADKSIEHTIPKDSNGVARPYFYGDRYYFYNCHRKEGDFVWFSDNLDKWPDGIKPENLNAFRTFDYKWDPENDSSLKVTGYELKGSQLKLSFNELVATRGKVYIQSNTGKLLEYISGSGRNILLFQSNVSLKQSDVTGKDVFLHLSGEIYAIQANVNEKKLPAKIILDKEKQGLFLSEKYLSEK